MFKILLNIVFTLWCSLTFGQRNYLLISSGGNIDLYKPWSEAGAQYQDSTGNISSDTWITRFQTNIIVKEKWAISVGLSYKMINYRVKDRIYKWNYSYSYFQTGTMYYVNATRIFNDPADLITTSKNFGLNLEFIYRIKHNNHLQSAIGLRPDIYLLEYYNSSYKSSDFSSFDIEESIPKPGPAPPKHFFFSSMNCDLFYRFTWYTDYFSLGAKIDAGINIYSDWAEFKRYGYLGLSFELGFGKFKTYEKD